MAAHIIMQVPGNGTAAPSTGIQFADSMYVLYEDARPIRLLPGPDNQKIVGCLCAIKPPTTAPTLAFNTTPATNIVFNAEFPIVYVTYAFGSQKRIVQSQMSPVAMITLTASPFQIVVSGFENSRDNATANFIDTLFIFVQQAANPGLMNIGAQMQVSVPLGDFSAQSYVFDLSAATLDQGFNGSDADPFFALPPAVKYASILGNRLCYGGTRPKVTIPGGSITVTGGQSFRGATLAEVTISGATFDDSLMWMTLVVAGNRLGDVFDVGGTANSNLVLYLDSDVAANISATSDFYFLGYNDRVWPSSYTDYTLGAIAVAYPECVNFTPGIPLLLTSALDGRKTLNQIKTVRNSLSVIFQDSITQFIGGTEVNVPEPVEQSNYGLTGTVAPASVCVDDEGSLVFWGQEGCILASTSGARSMMEELECLTFPQGGLWIDVDTLPNLTQAFSRTQSALIFGRISINGVPGFWGALHFQPQVALVLYDGRLLTSNNILIYPGSNGQDVILSGDAFKGRVVRLLDTNTFEDLPAASDTPAPYLCRWRGGYVAKQDGTYFNNAVLKATSALVPGSDCLVQISLWSANYPFRDATLLTGEQGQIDATQSFTKNDVPFQGMPLGSGQWRFQSVELSFLSTSGLLGTTPMRFPRYLVNGGGG